MTHPLDPGLRGVTCPFCGEMVTVPRDAAADIQKFGCGCVECTCNDNGWVLQVDPDCPIHGQRQEATS